MAEITLMRQRVYFCIDCDKTLLDRSLRCQCEPTSMARRLGSRPVSVWWKHWTKPGPMPSLKVPIERRPVRYG